jgi:hypothetical protein
MFLDRHTNQRLVQRLVGDFAEGLRSRHAVEVFTFEFRVQVVEDAVARKRDAAGALRNRVAERIDVVGQRFGEAVFDVEDRRALKLAALSGGVRTSRGSNSSSFSPIREFARRDVGAKAFRPCLHRLMVDHIAGINVGQGFASQTIAFFFLLDPC